MRKLFRSTPVFVFLVCLLLSLLAPVNAVAAAGNVIGKALVQTGGQTGGLPVAAQIAGSISVGTSTPNCYIAGAQWYTSSGTAVYSFPYETVHLDVQINAADGYSFAPDATAYINGDAATVISNAGYCLYIRSHDYTPSIWSPEIWKSPGPETVDEGGWASFVVSGQYVGRYEWYLENQDGTSSVRVQDALGLFPDLDFSGADTDKLILRSIPANMNGWKVYCRFWSVGDINSKRTASALITVRSVAPPPTPVPTPEPTPEPTPVPTPEPTPVPTPEPTPELDRLGGVDNLRFALYAVLGCIGLFILVVIVASIIGDHRDRRR